MTTAASNTVAIPPMDQHNETLVSNVHPPTWQNPTPTGRYNLVVIGGGTAGIVTAVGAAGLGAKVALIERHLLGGDCLNVGCVPSKCLIRSARAYADVRDAGTFGVRVPDGSDVDFEKVMERMRELRAQISHHDSAQSFTDQGVDVYVGEASFTGQDTIEVAGQTLQFKKAVICSGARAIALPIPGLEEAGYLTNETVFSLTQLPQRLAVIGAGPIGAEMAQSFQRFGSEVTLFEQGPHILAREDADAAAIVQEQLVKDGVQLALDAQISKVSVHGDSKVIEYTQAGESKKAVVDAILVGVGRAPNVEGLNLEKVGVEYTKFGVKVNDKLQTTNKRIYAAGDICMAWKFTHAADFAARIVIENALFFGSKKLSDLNMPWCTYTDPEIAHVGMYEKDAKEAGIEVTTYAKPFSQVDRAIAEGDTEGFVKIHVKKGSDKILGATIVARHAGEMISEVSVAMAGKLGLGALSKVIHPYPTQAEAIRHTGDAYNATLLTPFVAKLLKKFLAWRR